MIVGMIVMVAFMIVGLSDHMIVRIGMIVVMIAMIVA